MIARIVAGIGAAIIMVLELMRTANQCRGASKRDKQEAAESMTITVLASAVVIATVLIN